MKHFFDSIILLLFITNFAIGQVQFADFTDLQTVLTTAKNENKLVFVQVESTECEQCNIVAKLGLDKPELKKIYTDNFVSIRVKYQSEMYNQLELITDESMNYGSLYLNEDGILLHKSGMTSGQYQSYVEWANIAISANSKISEFAILFRQYEAGERGQDFMKNFIMKGREHNLYNYQWVEVLAKSLLPSQLRDTAVIRLILTQGMPINSYAYEMLYKKNTNTEINIIWYSLDNKERSNINNRVRVKTFQNAVKEKDYSLLTRLGNVIRNHYSQNPKGGNYTQLWYENAFYKSVHDTSRFLVTTLEFVRIHVMPENPEEKVKEVIRKRKEWEDESRKSAMAALGNKKPDMISFATTFESDKISSKLSDHAEEVYKHSKDTNYLYKALEWSTLAIKLFEANLPDGLVFYDPYMLDKHAKILYSVGRKEEAIAWEEKAIASTKKKSYPTPSYRGKSKANEIRHIQIIASIIVCRHL